MTRVRNKNIYIFVFCNTGTLGPSAILYEIARETLNARKGRKLYTCFVDFRKAFDWIQRDKLARKMQRFGMPKKFIELVLFIFNNTVMRVATDAEYVGKVKGTIGILQGDPMSCLIFNCFLADLPLEFVNFGPSIQGIQIPCLSYADDVALIAESATELKMMLQRLEDYCKENGLIINTKKTQIIIFCKGGYDKIPEGAKTFLLQGVQLELVKRFKYLGIIFTPQLTKPRKLNSNN